MKNLGVAARLFINERHIGGDSTFMDYYLAPRKPPPTPARFTRPRAIRLTALNSTRYPVGPVSSPFRQ